jgi:glycosyltransferase involved in cell wall biosynthesis
MRGWAANASNQSPASSDTQTASPRSIIAAALGNVWFLGLRDDVEQLYSAMDLYVLASFREGFPRSAMEAAAMVSIMAAAGA